MSEFIGARISLISKSDIRYVGTLHEINSTNSTVALENVKSYGTEGRRGDPASEVSASDQPYEYIVFRGSDVKDLRVEKPAEAEQKQPPGMPNDPAILGSSRPTPTAPAQQQQQPPPPSSNNGPYGQSFQPQNQFQQYQQQFPPQQPRFGAGRAGPYAFPSGPQQNFNYPPPGYQGRGGPPPPFPPSGPYGPPQHYGPPGVPPPGPHGQPSSGPPSLPTPGPAQELPEQTRQQTPANKSTTSAPPPPVDSKPPPEAAKAPPARDGAPATKSNKVPVAMPLPQAKPSQPSLPTHQSSIQQGSTETAAAAVAAAMAKLVPGSSRPTNGAAGIDNLTKQFNNLRTEQSQQRGGRANYRGRGNGRRGGRQTIEVPKDDFDFETANAKFNKEDLLKEATASPTTEDAPANGEDGAANGTSAGNGDVTIPAAPLYNRSTGFFDNISSEAKEKEDSTANGRKQSVHDMRNEERKRNIETFGMGTVDSGYYRGGRGRGRGRGFRGRGGPARGRGGQGAGQFRGESAVY